MARRILIVEESLAVRGIAESLLRQNGYEVFTAETADSAREIIASSKVDLILVSSGIVDAQGTPYYEMLGSDTATAALPLLILHDTTAGDLPYPPEAVIGKPFTPREFLDKVSIFGGQLPSSADQNSPFAGTDVEDDIIDAALGLDKLEVDDTRVMGEDTGVFRVMNKKQTREAMIGYEYKAQADDSSITKKKIDEIQVPPDAADKPGKPDKQQKPAPEAEHEFLGEDH